MSGTSDGTKSDEDAAVRMHRSGEGDIPKGKIRPVRSVSYTHLILFTGYYPEAGLLLRQMQEMKWAVPIIGGDATNNTDLVKIAGDAAAGYRFISPIMPADIDTPMAKAFLKAYEMCIRDSHRGGRGRPRGRPFRQRISGR